MQLTPTSTKMTASYSTSIMSLLARVTLVMIIAYHTVMISERTYTVLELET
jgi:hypothetical protein